MTKIVYKVTNKETDEVYIGVTTKSVEERKKDHYQKSSIKQQRKFYKAIGTYSPDAFTWEQIDTASTNDELAKKEKNYILKYNSKEAGYNSDKGGGIKKTIYKYNLDGNYIDSFCCLKKAGESVGVKKQQISRACINKKNCKGFY
ncbi:GIY-YIG nuclease family protein [Tenacibaculum singaporense]|uniref:GIY-YIG nuclease family protein n=1 Tax=Tenacibaculum singaporense TaxID=2358479 RepID=UPI001F0BACFD|nr:GIY-YIG nuclease family protein [Tenacibaculum singaporense]